MNKLLMTIILACTAINANATLYTYGSDDGKFSGSFTISNESWDVTLDAYENVNCTGCVPTGATYNSVNGNLRLTGYGDNIEIYSIFATELGDDYIMGSEYEWTLGPEGFSMMIDNDPRDLRLLSVVSEVPVPASAWLFMSALVGLVGKKRLSR